jgi:acetyl-CoA carboxylase carboxyl transferase subunit beta
MSLDADLTATTSGSRPVPDAPREARAIDRIRRRIEAAPASDWVRCPSCRAGLHRGKVVATHWTCPECGHHFRLNASQRIELLTDPGSFTERDADLVGGDPLGFTDSKPYPVRLAAARSRGASEAARYGDATLFGTPFVLAVMDFGFMGGSMGSVVGEKFARAAELADRQRRPLVIVSSSGGARMQEGIFSLLQMAKTAAALRRLAQRGVPYISVLTDPVYGGVSASFASLGDVILAEAGTRSGFAGPQVIEQTIRQKLPKGFQTENFLLAHGHIDAVLSRSELRLHLGRVLRFHAAAETGHRGPAGAGGTPSTPTVPDRPVSMDAPTQASADAWITVQRARDPRRPHLGDYLENVFDSFVELRGDRHYADDPALVGGLAELDGVPLIVVGHRKGRGTKEGVARNFGMPQPAGYRKALRLFRYADRFGLPLVTFVDTPGAYPGIAAEEQNQSGAIAHCIAELTDIRVPVVTVVVGEGGSGGALAVGVTDRLLMLENSVYSVISPEGCATILFGDAARAPDAARALQLTAHDLLRFGIADEVIPEPAGGAPEDPAGTAGRIRTALCRHLGDLAQLDPEDRAARRYERLRSFGA